MHGALDALPMATKDYEHDHLLLGQTPLIIIIILITIIIKVSSTKTFQVQKNSINEMSIAIIKQDRAIGRTIA